MEEFISGLHTFRYLRMSLDGILRIVGVARTAIDMVLDFASVKILVTVGA